MSLQPWHVLLAWPVSCGVDSPNSPATMLSDIQLQGKLKPLSQDESRMHKQLCINGNSKIPPVRLGNIETL